MGKKSTTEDVVKVVDAEDVVDVDTTVTFDLDAAEQKHAAERKNGDIPPFTFKLSGEELTLKDPEDVDWQTWQIAIESNSPYQILGALLNKEDGEVFFDATVSLRGMRDTLERWKAHYGVEELDVTPRSNPAANRAERRARGKAPRPRR